MKNEIDQTVERIGRLPERTLGQLVADRRKFWGMTYRELSKRSGRSIGRLSDIVSGKRGSIPYPLAEKLAKILSKPKIIELAANQRTIRISKAEYDQLKADLATAKQGLEHYAEELNWGLSDGQDVPRFNDWYSPVDEQMRYKKAHGYDLAQQTLDAIGKE